jgi:hypothetical protein
VRLVFPFVLPLRFMFAFAFVLPMFALRFAFMFAFEFMLPMLALAFVFVFVAMLEFAFIVEFVLVAMLVLSAVVVVVVVEVVLVFVALVFALVLFALSVVVQPAQRLATVSKARRAKVRRIEFPPVPLWGQLVGELRGR